MTVTVQEKASAQPFICKERRRSLRVRTVFFIARVTRKSDVGLFRVRNISDTGMMFATRQSFNRNEKVKIELSEKFEVEGTVEWCDEKSCGVRFEHSIACCALLRSLAAEKRERRRSARRLPVTRRATSYSDHGIRPVTITDVSPSGLGLIHDGDIKPGMFVKLVLETGLTRQGAVCWSHEGRAGVLLAEPFAPGELESAGAFEGR